MMCRSSAISLRLSSKLTSERVGITYTGRCFFFLVSERIALLATCDKQAITGVPTGTEVVIPCNRPFAATLPGYADIMPIIMLMLPTVVLPGIYAGRKRECEARWFHT
jgi:hypothetical protein